MNFTLALIAGLVLLLPGVAAIAAWNLVGGRDSARRPELQLSSVSALFTIILLAAFAHLMGWALVQLAWTAAVEFGSLWPGMAWPALLPNPYLIAFQMAADRLPADLPADDALLGIGLFVVAVMLEAMAMFFFVAHEGLDLAFANVDLRSQGWVHQHVVRPVRHGYSPVAYVMTTHTQGAYAVGYRGIIAELRQGADGEIKVLCLAEPYALLYEFQDAKPTRGRPEPRLKANSGKWLGGVVTIDGSNIRNIVVHNIAPGSLADIAELVDEEVVAA